MKKILLIPILFFCAIAVHAQQNLTADSLKKMTLRQIEEDKSRWVEMELMLEEPAPVDSTEADATPPDPKLDSAVSVVLADYQKRGFCFYPFGFNHNTVQHLMETRYHVYFYPDDTSENIDYGFHFYYNACMKALFRQKHGWNIFQKLFIEGQKLDGSGKGTRKAMFPGGGDEMYTYIYCNLNLLGTKEKNADDHNYYVSMQIDEQGKMDSITISNGNYDDPRDDDPPPTPEALKQYEKHLKEDKKYLDEVMRVVKDMPAWLPATKNGQAICSQTWFTVYFSESTKQQYKCKN